MSIAHKCFFKGENCENNTSAGPSKPLFQLTYNRSPTQPQGQLAQRTCREDHTSCSADCMHPNTSILNKRKKSMCAMTGNACMQLPGMVKISATNCNASRFSWVLTQVWNKSRQYHPISIAIDKTACPTLPSMTVWNCCVALFGRAPVCTNINRATQRNAGKGTRVYLLFEAVHSPTCD